MKQLLILVVSATMLAMPVAAQVYVGEEAPPEESLQSDQTQRQQGKPARDSYLNLVYFMPSLEPAIPFMNAPFTADMGPKFGAGLEWGKFRFFSHNFIGGVGNIGLYTGMGLYIATYDYNLPDDFEGRNMPFLFGDIKLGPDFRLDFSRLFKIDIYGHIGYLASYGGIVDADNYDISLIPVNLAGSLQTGGGINFVLGKINLGVQFTFAQGKYEYERELWNLAVSDTEVFENISLNAIRAHFGFIF